MSNNQVPPIVQVIALKIQALELQVQQLQTRLFSGQDTHIADDLANLQNQISSLTKDEAVQQTFQIEQKDVTQAEGDLEEQAYDLIDSAIDDAESRDDKDTASQVSGLMALRDNVPMLLSIPQMTIVKIQEQVNKVLGEPNSSSD